MLPHAYLKLFERQVDTSGFSLLTVSNIENVTEPGKLQLFYDARHYYAERLNIP
jgi:hypothetical protein